MRPSPQTSPHLTRVHGISRLDDVCESKRRRRERVCILLTTRCCFPAPVMTPTASTSSEPQPPPLNSAGWKWVDELPPQPPDAEDDEWEQDQVRASEQLCSLCKPSLIVVLSFVRFILQIKGLVCNSRRRSEYRLHRRSLLRRVPTSRASVGAPALFPADCAERDSPNRHKTGFRHVDPLPTDRSYGLARHPRISDRFRNPPSRNACKRLGDVVVFSQGRRT
jgi:hypothetical protein